MIKVFVTLNPGSSSEKVINEIIQRKLALEVSLDEIQLFSEDSDGKRQVRIQSEISFITKALLYQEIENWIMQDFKDIISTFYAIPIVNMNMEYSKEIRSKLKSV